MDPLPGLRQLGGVELDEDVGRVVATVALEDVALQVGEQRVELQVVLIDGFGVLEVGGHGDRTNRG